MVLVKLLLRRVSYPGYGSGYESHLILLFTVDLFFRSVNSYYKSQVAEILEATTTSGVFAEALS